MRASATIEAFATTLAFVVAIMKRVLLSKVKLEPAAVLAAPPPRAAVTTEARPGGAA